MTNSWVIFKGLACGALVAAMSSLVSAAFYIRLMIGFRESKGFEDALLLVGSIAFVVSLLMASVLGFLIGVPMFRASLRTRRTALNFYTMAGVAIAIFVIALAVVGHLFLGLLLRSDLYFFAVSALIGAPAAATAFWLVVRPDKVNTQ